MLFSALTALGAMLALNKLPHPAHALDRVKRFARVTDDRYYVIIQASDPLYDDKETRSLLQNSKARLTQRIAAPGKATSHQLSSM